MIPFLVRTMGERRRQGTGWELGDEESAGRMVTLRYLWEFGLIQPP